jgi:LuxR family transcriptional regulator, maltose regulon positive regulatory protein
MTGPATRQRGEHVPQLISREGSGARGLLDRKDLLQLLDRAVTKRITVISAPPGSGKTSLLRVWSERPSQDRQVAFVSVPRDQHDAQQFWLAALDAIRQSAATADSRSRTTSLGFDHDDAIVDTIVSELSEQAKVVVLIIDDLHELRSAEALTQLEYFLAILPRTTRVVLSSRRDPPIRLHKLRLAGEVAEIRASDLRFTERETHELLAASGISLSDSGAAALYQRTEGWAAGLRLAVISLNDHPDPERFVAEFSGTDRAVGEYLMAEMLERQPSEVQSMLLRTSLVDRLNGELADLLAGRPGAEQMLLALEDANAFVVSLDAERTWFRYHHLLADFLRLELRRQLADQVPDLHRRAARWLADHGEVVEAVRHTLAAGDWPHAARLLADHLFSLTLDGQEGTISALLQAFPAGASAEHPELALAHAAVQLAHGRSEEAAAQLALADSHVQNAEPARRRLTVAIASLRLALARRSGQFTEVIEQVNLLDASVAARSNEPIAMSSELRAVALMNLGIVETWSGRFDDAERHLSEGAMLAHAIGRPYVELACRAHQGFPSTLVSLNTARERARQAVALAESHGWEDRPILAPALGAVAATAIWTGEFDEGERWLRRAWEVADPQIDPAAAVLVQMATGMLHAGRGQHQSALEAYAAAAHAQSLLTGVYALASPIIGWLAATQARLGRPDEARASLTGFFAEFGRRLDTYNARAVIFLAEGDPATAVDALGDAQNIARAAICLAEGNPAAAVEVLADVQDMTPPVGSAFPPFGLVEAQVLAGIAFLHLGDRNAAAAAVEAALAAAERDRLIFPFAMIDAADLLDTLPHHQTAHAALLADIVDLLRGAPVSRTHEDRPQQSPELSPTELRVLRYLPTNLTRHEIASELYLSVNTVNTHIRNVYAKLGARDRSSAVQRARELRLVSSRLARTPS